MTRKPEAAGYPFRQRRGKAERAAGIVRSAAWVGAGMERQSALRILVALAVAGAGLAGALLLRAPPIAALVALAA